MNFPAALFELDDSVSTVQEVIDKLKPLGLKWQVEDDPANHRARAIAPLYLNSTHMQQHGALRFMRVLQ